MSILMDRLSRYCSYHCEYLGGECPGECQNSFELEKIKYKIKKLKDNKGFLINDAVFFEDKDSAIYFLETRIFQEIVNLFNADILGIYLLLPVLENLSCFYEFEEEK